MNKVVTKKLLIWHCSFTPESMDVSVEQIRSWHTRKGWSDIGYQYLIDIRGVKHKGRDLDGDGNVNEETGAHAYGFNKESIGACYAGGMGKDGKPKDTRNLLQLVEMQNLTKELIKEFPEIVVIGHNQVSKKDCPCFDVYEWGKAIGLDEKNLHKGKYTK